MKKKILLWLGYVTFSLIVPIFIVNIKFPFTDLFEGKSTWYKVSIGLIIVFAIRRALYIDSCKNKTCWTIYLAILMTSLNRSSFIFLLVC